MFGKGAGILSAALEIHMGRLTTDPLRVLYAEDDPADADLTAIYFEQSAPEFELEIASTGRTCLARLHEREFDVLLLDNHLPDMDGIDVLRELVSDEHDVANPVVSCLDGEEALRYIDEHQVAADTQIPILILLDLRLPKVDGFEVLRQVRNHPVWKQVPVVVMTTSRQDDDIESAYKLGVNSYIVKPVDFGAFAEMVKTIKVYWMLTNEPPFSDNRR